MGGASSAPASAASGGYSSPAAMARATIGGTTGSNVAGMGYVPRAQAASSGAGWNAIGNAITNASGQFGNAIANQQYGSGISAGTGLTGMFTPESASFFQPAAPFSFDGLAGNMPQVSPSKIASATSPYGMARPTTGFRI